MELDAIAALFVLEYYVLMKRGRNPDECLNWNNAFGIVSYGRTWWKKMPGSAKTEYGLSATSRVAVSQSATMTVGVAKPFI
jgi:hypothetical protein